MSTDIRGEWVNAVLVAAIKQHPQAPVQMTILTLALTTAARTLGIPKEALLDVVSQTYDKVSPGVRIQG